MILLFLIILGASARLLPHPANFAPITAIALFAGLYLPRRIALFAPLLAMLASDFVIGFYDWRMMLAVYGSFLVSALIGNYIKNKRSFFTIVGATLISSGLFFLVTNAAVWIFGTMYPHTISGLGQSYFMAIPFFRSSILGDFFYVGVLIGGMELYQQYLSFQQKKQPIAS